MTKLKLYLFSDEGKQAELEFGPDGSAVGACQLSIQTSRDFECLILDRQDLLKIKIWIEERLADL